jgi:spermidine synthase
LPTSTAHAEDARPQAEARMSQPGAPSEIRRPAQVRRGGELSRLRRAETPAVRRARAPATVLFVLALGVELLPAAVVFETTSPYHNIRVIDQAGVRTLSFDGSMETRMSLANPLTGHFEYTEFFHLPWLWNTNLKQVLMIGLGGGSTQRAYQHYYRGVQVDTAEIDPVVVQVSAAFFGTTNSATHSIHVEDGRVFLRRSTKHYDAILLDAYRTARYGSFIPYHLTTKEFFQLARDHLTTNGVVAYNVIGSVHGFRADLLGAMFKTMKSVFPQVYLFPARDSQNVVLMATRSSVRLSRPALLQAANRVIAQRQVRLAGFYARAASFVDGQPGSVAFAPLLTDDHAPVDGLLSVAPRATAQRATNRVVEPTKRGRTQPNR